MSASQPVLVGLAGRGIAGSRTPAMHEAEAGAQGLRLAYSLFDFTARGWPDSDLPLLLDAARRTGFAGLNITYPFKQAVIAHLDELDPRAQAVGAVNTVTFRKGRAKGWNTDVTGFATGFADGLQGAALDRVLLLGCGGAGSAAAHALLGIAGCGLLLICDNDLAKREALCQRLASQFGADRVCQADDAALAAQAADGVVNATPVGMASHPGLPLPAMALSANHWVADVVYVPLETELLAHARRIGCRTLDGSGMAVGQAVDAFALFTGRAAEPERMRAAFLAAG